MPVGVTGAVTCWITGWAACGGNLTISSEDDSLDWREGSSEGDVSSTPGTPKWAVPDVLALLESAIGMATAGLPRWATLYG